MTSMPSIMSSNRNKTLFVSGVLLSILPVKYVYDRMHRQWHNYPNGPIEVPILGSLIQYLVSGQHQFQIKLYECNNQVAMCYILNSPVVYINDLRLFQSTFKDLTTIDPQYSFEPSENAEFALQNGKEWKHRRNLIHQSFSMMLQTSYLDKVIPMLMSKYLYPILDIYAKNGVTFTIRSNIKWFGFSLLFGAIFGNKNIKLATQNNQHYVRYILLVHRIFEKIIIAYAVRKMPNLFRKVFRKPLQKFLKINEDVQETVHIVSFWARKYIENKNAINHCCFDKMLEFIEDGSITFEKACADINALFLGGTHVTLAIIETGVYYLSKYDDIQQEIYNELQLFYDENNLEYDYHLKLTSINQLHIFRAFCMELMRFGGVVPSSLPRVVNSNDFKIGKYDIPKGATILGNIWAIHRSAQYWTYPNKFYLKHFLNENNKFRRNNAFCLFGFGKRSCVGQQVAMKELFSVLSALLMRYRFRFDHSIISKDVQIPLDWLTTKTKQLPLVIEKR